MRNGLATGAALALVVGGAPPAAGEPAPGVPDAGDDPRSVTLITGDRVLVGVDGSAEELIAGPGREGVGFSTFEVGGHDHVVPLDAGPLLGSGKLDRQLFDVTGLAEAGYDDANMASLPLLVTYAEGQRPGVGVQEAPGMALARTLASINGAAVRAEKASLSKAWVRLTAGGAQGAPPAAAPRTLPAGIERIWLDARWEASLDVSVPQIGAPAAWDAGFTGEGVRIAVLDSGVDESHPDLAEREVAERNFSDAETNEDHFGHGTHVASIAAGTGAASDGTYTGVAHGAQVVDGKVLNDLGLGFASWIIAGMEWAAVEQDADIVNLSLGGANTARVDPVEEALNSLTAEEGTLFVVAAGNLGPEPSTVDSPASARAALAVGAVDDQNQLAEFSARGPLPGGRAVKPEITGPGVDIAAARSSHGLIGEPVGERYTELSGTSMASPHVAGATALLLDQHPGLGAIELKAMLMAAARPTKGATVHEQGVGRVDSAAGVEQTLHAQPPNAALGIQEWPHFGEEPARQEVTYTNLGDTPVTLDLSLDVSGPDGQPAPDGLFALSERRTIVPANGTAAVTLVGDVNAVNNHQRYAGLLLATAPGQTVRTPVNIEREPESYDLTLRNIDRDGTLTGSYFTTLLDIDDNDVEFPYEQDGTVTLRLPRGEYLLQSVIRTGEGQEGNRDLLAYPKLELTRDTTIDFDARAAEPIHLNPPNPDAELTIGQVQYTRDVDGLPFRSGVTVLNGPIEHIGSAHLGPRLPLDELTALVNTQWVTPDGGEYYGLAWYEYGAVPTGFIRLVRPSDLATVHAHYGAVRGDTVGGAGAAPSEHGHPRQATSILVDIPLPFERTEHYNVDDRQVDWNRSLFTSAENRFVSSLRAPPRQFLPGRTYTERFNDAVFAPVLPLTYRPDRWVTRDEDVIDVNVPMFGDGNGNWGRSNFDTATTRLYRDGELVEELDSSGVGRFQVRGAPADYRLEVETTRPSAFGLSTRVSAAWTFRSATTAEPTRLPISTIRYFPALDENDSAPAGRVFTIPVAVQEQATNVTRTPHRLTAEVSYDHGRTWTPAEVVGGSTLRVHHPNNAETVSLRATAIDGSGNSVTQTVVDAYHLR